MDRNKVKVGLDLSGLIVGTAMTLNGRVGGLIPSALVYSLKYPWARH